jgi:hypothetical protein
MTVEGSVCARMTGGRVLHKIAEFCVVRLIFTNKSILYTPSQAMLNISLTQCVLY